MKIPPSQHLIAGFALLFAGALHVRADESKPAPPSSASNLSNEQTTKHPAVISIDFPGGPVSQFTAAWANADNRMNIIADQVDLSSTLPAFSLRNTYSEEISQVLRILLRERGIELTQVGPETDILTKFRPEQHFNNRQFESVNLSPFLDSLTVDAIVDAIRTACAMDPNLGADALQLKYHPATKLLLVSGPNAGFPIFDRVMNTLQRSPQKDGHSKAEPGPPSNPK